MRCPNEVLGVNVAGISSIVISGGVNSSFTFDDASFPGAINPVANPVVPEPATLTMLLGGLGCIAVFGRRRRPSPKSEPK